MQNIILVLVNSVSSAALLAIEPGGVRSSSQNPSHDVRGTSVGAQNTMPCQERSSLASADSYAQTSTVTMCSMATVKAEIPSSAGSVEHLLYHTFIQSGRKSKILPLILVPNLSYQERSKGIQRVPQ